MDTIVSLVQKRPSIFLSKMKDSCNYDIVREIETAQAELAQELSKGQLPLPLIPKDDSSTVLVLFWYDNFDVMKGRNSILEIFFLLFWVVCMVLTPSFGIKKA